jgi:hypothetical protein
MVEMLKAVIAGVLISLALWLYGGTIGAICILVEKVFHWLLLKRGVTELTWRQRRGMAKRYKETTGRKFIKGKARRTR